MRKKLLRILAALRHFGLVGLLLGATTAPALDLTGITNSHDPSTLVRDGDTYFHFTTGNGIWYSRSTNLVHWDNPADIFGSSWPVWINAAVPGFKGHFWAPDAIQMGDYYYVYYSVSTFGSSRSAIGVVRTPSLKTPNWQDLGMVVQSFGGQDEINAIDAALFRDHDGKVYMSYGSWFGGLGVAEIDQNTGKLASSVTKIYGGGHQSIEAPYISRQGNYYYLYFTRGLCCRGADSTYQVQVARASNVLGPYSGERNLLPNQDGKRKGPGHIGILKQDGCQYVSTHYYDLTDGGNAKLDIQRMTFSAGWPSLTHNYTAISQCGGVSEGLYQFSSRRSGKLLEVADADSSNGGNVVQYQSNGGLHQAWYLLDLGTGQYSLINANSLKALDVWEISTVAGANIAQWDYWGSSGQRWRIKPVSNYVEVESVLSNMLLDVERASTSNGANVIQWPRSGRNNQHWLMQRRY
jgi:arabinan endo-1,5-alpha-L-arabinosidase